MQLAGLTLLPVAGVRSVGHDYGPGNLGQPLEGPGAVRSGWLLGTITRSISEGLRPMSCI